MEIFMKRKKIGLGILLTAMLLVLSVSGISGVSDAGKVEAASAKVSINKKKATMKVGKKLTLKVKNATKKVIWSTSNKSVVRIRAKKGSNKQNATIQAVKSGKATITAKVGSKRLRSKITVSHVHRFTIPPTCTQPRRCACGATADGALGHSWTAATCTQPSVCTRCRATTGVKADHNYLRGYCRYCEKMDLQFFVQMRIANTGYETEMVKLELINAGPEALQICDVESEGMATLYRATGAPAMTVRLYNNNRYISAATLRSGASGNCFFAHASEFSLDFTARIEFVFWYGHDKYMATVDRKGYTFKEL